MAEKRLCARDSVEFEPRRPNAVYCSDACRQAASRARRKAKNATAEEAADGVTPQEPSAVAGVSLAQTTREYLQDRELAGLPLAVNAIALAHEIDGYGRSRDGLSALASASRALADILEKLGSGKTAGDRGDELADQREKRRRKARGA